MGRDGRDSALEKSTAIIKMTVLYQRPKGRMAAPDTVRFGEVGGAPTSFLQGLQGGYHFVLLATIN